MLDGLLPANTLPLSFDIGSDPEGPKLADTAFIAEVLEGDTDSPLEWDVRARWEKNGIRAWMIVQAYYAGAGVYDAALVTHDGDGFAKHDLGTHMLSECEDNVTLVGEIQADGAVKVTQTEWQADCESEDEPKKSTVTKIVGLDGSERVVEP